MKILKFLPAVAFVMLFVGESSAATCKAGQVTCEQWCNKYAIAKHGSKGLATCFNACAKKKNGAATCVKDG